MSESTSPLIELPMVARGAPTLTVVVPCYNERPNVAPLIAKLDAALYGIAWEVGVSSTTTARTAQPPRSAASPRPIRASAASAASAAAAWPPR